MNSNENQILIKRRSALKMLGLSSAAMLAGGFGDLLGAEPMLDKPKVRLPEIPGHSPVSFTTGTDRQQMIFEVIRPFESEIRKGLKGKQLVIKPNMVVTNNELCATHVDALRALLEYMKPIYKGQILIAESSATPNPSDGFKNYGYLELAKDYNIKFVDLNTTPGKSLFIMNKDLHLDRIQIADLFLDPSYYIITISRLKTHDTVVMTGAVKNILLGAPHNLPATGGNKPVNYKRSMHSAGPRWLHYNMYQVAQHIRPDFSIIDGVEGMEGNGPVNGTAVDHRIALAGLDPASVDSICCKLMDIPLADVGYLNYMEAAGLGVIDRAKIDIIGSEKPDNHVFKYKLNANATYQLQWKDPLELPGTNRPAAPAQPAQPQRN